MGKAEYLARKMQERNLEEEMEAEPEQLLILYHKPSTFPAPYKPF